MAPDPLDQEDIRLIAAAIVALDDLGWDAEDAGKAVGLRPAVEGRLIAAATVALDDLGWSPEDICKALRLRLDRPPPVKLWRAWLTGRTSNG